MARGWDSKSVESQIESARAHKTSTDLKPEEDVSPAEMERLREWETLMLSRTRVLHQMDECQNPRYRMILDKALADLESKLATLKFSRAAHGG